MITRPYRIANGDAASSQEYSTEYTAEYFDVYSPLIRTQYSQVYWAMQTPVPLPEEIVQRFKDGKVMAVTGYEVDQVRQLEDGSEASVPITWAYNHHYGAWLVKQSRDTKKRLYQHHGDHSYRWESTNETFSEMEFFSEGNGGEFRSSYHGYPQGYAQLIQSPDYFYVNPMQIDTWNRSSSDSTYHPGPLPKSSRIPTSAGYNGLIECPCSDRIEKEWHMSYSIDSNDCSDGEIENPAECLKAAQQVAPSSNYHVVSNDTDVNGTQCSLAQHLDGEQCRPHVGLEALHLVDAPR